MKKVGQYTTRGQFAEGTVKRIQLFDGRFDTGYRVVDFRICSSDIGSSGDNCSARLTTEDIGAMPPSGEDMVDFADNRQIGWAAISGQTNGFENQTPIIDPDNLIVEDLYVSGQHASTHPINYMITLEKYDITDWQGALAMVRNSAQDV